MRNGDFMDERYLNRLKAECKNGDFLTEMLLGAVTKRVMAATFDEYYFGRRLLFPGRS